MRRVVFALVLAAASAAGAPMAFDAIHEAILAPHATVARPEQLARYKSTMRRWTETTAVAVDESPAVFPVDFGADPTGKTDSSDAFDALMRVVLARGNGAKLANNITDLGGVTVDLQGGTYLISRPIEVPVYYGNLRFTAGSLRAAATWSNATAFLIDVGTGVCKKTQQDCCNMNIGIDHLFFDAAHLAAGSVRITRTMGSVVGPMTYHAGFLYAGVHLLHGHEGIVQSSWFGAYYWGDPRKADPVAYAGIFVDGPDHFVQDSIVFSGVNGLVITAGATLVTGLHTWNCGTEHGGRGIVVQMRNNRFESIYMDFTDFAAVDPTGIVVANSFFLGGGRVELIPNDGVVLGMDLRDNVYWHAFGIPDGKTIIINTTSPWSSGKPFHSVTDASVSGTLVEPGGSFKPLSTRVTRTVKVTSSTSSVQIDFQPHMPFTVAEAPLQSVVASVSADTGFPVAAARFDSSSLTVTVETSEPFTGSVTVTADQSMRTVDL